MKIFRIKLNWQARAVIVFSVGVLIFLPTHFSNACVPWDVACMAREGASWIFISLRFVFASITEGLMSLLNYAVYARAYNNIPIVVSMWKILRDLANMFFILALIYMAFATIFQIGKYRFQDMIWRFLIVAVFINFSLVLGGLVIDGTQVLTNVFLNMIGNPGDKIGQFLDPSLLFKDTVDSGDTIGPGFVGLVFGVILSGMFMFSLLIAVVFTLFRTLAIWGLLIVAPIAWMAYILPGTNQWFSKWWGWVFGWNLFLPVYLFILYLGLVFLSQGKQVIQKVIGAGDATLFGTGNITINLIFFYGFATLFMYFGTWMATKMTTAFGGDGFSKGVDWARTTVGKITTYDAKKKALTEAVSERAQQFQKEGFKNKYLNKIYGGKEADDRLKSRIAGGLGVRDAKQDQLSKDVGSWKERMKNLDPEELRKTVENRKLPLYQQLAARELLRDIGHLSKDELVETYDMYGGQKSGAARKFLLDIDFSKMSKDEREQLYKTMSGSDKLRDVKIMQKLAKSMADEGDFGIKDADVDNIVDKAKELYGNNALGQRELLDSVKKKNILAYAKAYTKAMTNLQIAMPEVKDENGNTVLDVAGNPTRHTADTYFVDQILKAKDLGDQGIRVWGDRSFQDALLLKIQKAQQYNPRRETSKGKVTPGGGERMLRALKDSMKENPAKLQGLELIETQFDIGPTTRMLQAKAPVAPTPAQGQKASPQTSKPETQPGERLSQGGIILTPGAQFDIDKEKKAEGVSYRNIPGINQANVVDLRNKKDIEIK